VLTIKISVVFLFPFSPVYSLFIFVLKKRVFILSKISSKHSLALQMTLSYYQRKAYRESEVYVE
jgi:hypothetical protein